MTFERPGEVSEALWAQALASEHVFAMVSDDRPEGWTLSVRSAPRGFRQVTLAEFDFPPTAKRPSRVALDRQLSDWELTRTDDWEDIVLVEGFDPELQCSVALPEAIANDARSTVQTRHAEAQRAREERDAGIRRSEATSNFTLWRRWTIGLGVFGALLNLLALGPFPSSDYHWFRVGIFLTAMVLAVLVGRRKSWGWLLLLVPAAILWNPVVDVDLTRAGWAPLNIVAVVGFVVLAVWATRQRQRP